MSDLFSHARDEARRRHEPLASRMRPRRLEEYVGQEHILGPGRLLRRAIQIDQISSLLFYGPPGTGKTTLARVIANSTKCHFHAINAVLAGVKDIREAIDFAEGLLGREGKKTLLFVDEVHRFNKSQQDALLPHVENGLLTLIGATTENPYFEVNKALVSRSRIFELRPLSDANLAEVARQAIRDEERGFGGRNVEIDEAALDHLVRTASGDARSLLNALELAVETTEPDVEGRVRLTLAICEESIQKKALLYDKDGDIHYDTISAFIKSVRGSDPDAALYWMARMLAAGEDPRFLFRRMIILASEDVGLADPRALEQVMAASQAFDYVGLPEGRYHLSQACLYLATAPKSNSTMAFFDAIKSVETEKIGEVPDPLRDASRDKEGFGHGQGYLYPHSWKEHWVAQEYLPKELRGKMFYQPGRIGYERSLAEETERRRELVIARAAEGEAARSVFEERESGDEGALFERVRDVFATELPILRDRLGLVRAAGSVFLFNQALRLAKDKGMAGIIGHCEKSDVELLTARIPHGIDSALWSLAVREDSTSPWEIPGEAKSFDQIWTFDERIETRSDVFFRGIASSMNPGAEALCAWRDPSASQRLLDLVDIPESLREAEARWRLPLAKVLPGEDWIRLGAKAAGLRMLYMRLEAIRSPRRIRSEEVESWFRSEDISLGSRIEKEFGAAMRDEIRRKLLAEVAGRTIPWMRALRWVRLARP